MLKDQPSTSPSNSPKSPPLLGVVLSRLNGIKPTPQKPQRPKFKRRSSAVWNKPNDDGIYMLLNAAAYCQTPPPVTSPIQPEQPELSTDEQSTQETQPDQTSVNFKFVFFPPTKKFFWISVNDSRRHELYERSTVRELYELKNGQQIKLYHYTCLKRGADKFCKNCANRQKSHLKCLATKEVWVWHPAVDGTTS